MRRKWLPWVTGIFAGLFVLAGVMIFRELYGRQEAIHDFQELAALIEPETTRNPTDNTPLQPDTGAGEIPTASSGKNLQPLFDKNADCLGWISIEGTAVNYPVMHTPEDPEKYLHKNFDREYSAAGVPFLDADCDETCHNLILYAHNMKNGTMFADVTKYRKKDFATAHPVIWLETAAGAKTYRVFAVVRLQDSDPWYDFFYAADEAQYDAMVADIRDRALYDLEFAPQYGQQLLTLSTCYGSEKTDRILVIGAETD